MSTTAVSVLGLGAMGRALAAALLAAGHPTTVWNRTPGRAVELTGAQVAATPRAAVEASGIVVVCLVDPAATTAVLDQVGDALAGHTVIDLTNTTPQQARARAAAVTAAGAAHVDGGIMAVPPMIGGPDVLLVLSGDRAAFDAAAPVLSALGTRRFVGADPGLAALYDIALLSGMYGMYGGALHAFALARAAGLAATDLAPLLQDWLAAMLTALPETAAEIDAEAAGGTPGPATSPLRMQAAGFVNLLTTADEVRVAPDLLVPMGRLLNRAVADGRGKQDISALAPLLTAPR